MERAATGAPSEEGIGERVKRLRAARELSQRNLARGAGISAAYLSRIEKGDRSPSTRVIRTLARRLGVTAEYLETGVEITTREELELSLADLELQARLSAENEDLQAQFRGLVRLAEQEGERDIAARARAGLGMTQAVAGRLGDAACELERAIAHPLFSAEVYPDAYTTLADVYRKLGKPDAAVTLCEQTLAELHSDAVPLRTILATHLSHALSDSGEFARAEQVLSELEADIELVDPYARARMHWSLARVATMQNKRRLALRHMHRAINLLKGTEDIDRLARAHVLCAEILLWGDRTAGVRKHLDAANTLLPPTADAAARGSLLALEALFAARQHRYLEAALAASESLAMLSENEAQKPTALYARALAAASEGHITAADHDFDQAITTLTKMKIWREAATIATDWARTLTEAGKPIEAQQATLLAKRFIDERASATARSEIASAQR